MKHIVLVLLAIATHCSIYGQECTSLKREKDIFTGLETVKSLEYDLSDADVFEVNTTLNCVLSKIGDVTYLKTKIMRVEIISKTILPTDTLLVVLENGKLLKLTPYKTFEGSYVNGQGGSRNYFRPIYTISKENLIDLSSSTVKKIRIPLDGNRDVGFVSRNQAKNFMEAAKCML